MVKLIHKFKRSYNLKMSPNGKLIISTNSSQINIFDAQTYNQIAQFKDLKNITVYFSNNNKKLLAKTTDGKFGLYNLETKELEKKFSLKKNKQPQDGCCFSSNDSQIINLVYNNDLMGYISVWDLDTLHETRYHENENHVFKEIEYIVSKDKYFVSGFSRPVDDNTKHNIPFYMWFDPITNISEFVNTDLTDNEEFRYIEKLDSVVAFSANKISLLLNKSQDIDLIYRVSGIAISNNNDKIAVMFEKHAVVYRFPEFDRICELDTNQCFGPISFSPDDSKVLIGTWESGFVYEI